MNQFYTESFNKLIYDILDLKIKEVSLYNKEIKDQNFKINNFEKKFNNLLSKLPKDDVSIIDNYLTMNNDLNSIMLSEIYKSGFYDCVKLLKHINII
ncbi:hypothetical protein [Vallitalea guaymasensis]|uniref:Uncharacterized protein n=1 Tax=Vallitalea guaymasensis TaxID=1185412 RepID=A0A8J8M881_9FIRM|nr:hypothetical protein [Vallitalea guaymasensis]QUH27930.1 hypothetical protein HYG85_02975 [Vallitalea guaymasensis]